MLRPGQTPQQKKLAMMFANNSGGFTIPRAGLAASFDASLGVTSSGGFASAWADQSGNGRSLLQATGANQPIHLPFAGEKYGWLPGVNSIYFSTPDSVAASVTGSIACVIDLAMADYTPASTSMLLDKSTYGGSNASYSWYITSTGKLNVELSPDGGSAVSASSSVSPTVADGARIQLAFTWNQTTKDVKFFTATDGATWTQLGTTQTANIAAINDCTRNLRIGDRDSALNLNAKVYSAQVYNGIPPMLGGSGSASPVVNFAPSSWTSGSTFTAPTGEVWTIANVGSKPAQIVDRASLLFDGAAHYMKTASFTLNQPVSMYFVYLNVAAINTGTLTDSLTTNQRRLYQTGAVGDLWMYAGSGPSPTNTDFDVGSYQVATAIFNGASSVLQKNANTGLTGDPGTSAGSGISIGATPLGVNLANIQIKEFLVYNVAHDASTRANIIRALMSKHGVA